MNGYAIIENLCKEHIPSALLFFRGDKMYITKKNDEGFYCTAEACKDPNSSGNKYVWKHEINNHLNKS